MPPSSYMKSGGATAPFLGSYNKAGATSTKTTFVIEEVDSATPIGIVEASTAGPAHQGGPSSVGHICGPDFDRNIVEVCCGDDSVLCRATRSSKGCHATRITREIDFLTQAGVDAVFKATIGPRTVIWLSMPCIGGCPWQYVNIVRGGPAAARRIKGYWSLFAAMWKNAMKVIAFAYSVNATVVIEWPRQCRYWFQVKVVRDLRKYGLLPYDFDGCEYGIKSIVKKSFGKPIKKPWRIATNSKIIGSAFSLRCRGHVDHAVCQGGGDKGDTRHTESYSPEFAHIFHKAFRAHCDSLDPVHPTVCK
jgi:hypothetical protein